MSSFTNPNLDIAPFAEAFRRDGFVQIPNFLSADAAELVLQHLEQNTPWDQTYFVAERSENQVMPESQWLSLNEQQQQTFIEQRKLSDDEFDFWYESFMMVSAYQNRRHPSSILHKVLELINSLQYRKLMSDITGITQFNKLDAQATRYRAGHFLKKHNDENADHQRQAAYVLGFSKDWLESDGGLLQFFDDDGKPTQAFVPEFNTLTLFAVPKWHEVTKVAERCDKQRLSITGWLRSN